jgi:hypothetical protein
MAHSVGSGESGSEGPREQSSSFRRFDELSGRADALARLK